MSIIHGSHLPEDASVSESSLRMSRKLREIRIDQDGHLTFTFSKKSNGRKFDENDSDEQSEKSSDRRPSISEDAEEDESPFEFVGRCSRQIRSVLRAKERVRLGRSCTIFIVFGCNSTLAKQKIFPSLFWLHAKKQLPEEAMVVAYGRTDQSISDYRTSVASKMLPEERRRVRSSEFWGKVRYVQGGFTQADSTWQLERTLRRMEDGYRDSHRIFYLTVIPKFYDASLRTIGEAFASRDKEVTVVLDQLNLSPRTAQFRDQSNMKVIQKSNFPPTKWFDAVKTLRQANVFFSALWNRRHISSVTIAIGSSKVANASPNRTNVVEDMLQEPFLHLLCLVVMDMSLPSKNPRDISKEKLRVLRSLQVDDKTVELDAGEDSDVGSDCPGRSGNYQYLSMTLYLRHDNWRGVPFKLKYGKGIKEDKTEVRIVFSEEDNGIKKRSCAQNEVKLNFCENQVKGSLVLQNGVKRGARKHHVDLGFLFSDDNFRRVDGQSDFIRKLLLGQMPILTSSSEESSCIAALFNSALKKVKRENFCSRYGDGTKTFQRNRMY